MSDSTGFNLVEMSCIFNQFRVYSLAIYCSRLKKLQIVVAKKIQKRSLILLYFIKGSTHFDNKKSKKPSWF